MSHQDGNCYRCGDEPPLYAWRFPADTERKHILCAECWDWLDEQWKEDPSPIAYTRLVMQMLRTHTVWRRAKLR